MDGRVGATRAHALAGRHELPTRVECDASDVAVMPVIHGLGARAQIGHHSHRRRAVKQPAVWEREQVGSATVYSEPTVAEH